MLREVVLSFDPELAIPTDIDEEDRNNFIRMKRVRSQAGCPPLSVVFGSGEPVPGL